MDLLGSVALLLVASPILLVTAVLVRLDSRGPALFIQERVGLAGRQFRVIKFRTMYVGSSADQHREHVSQQINKVDAEAARDGNGNSFKLNGDARVTRVGRWLRRTSLDELPQLFNVLAGQMSLVGPRPPLPYELEHYEPWQFARLAVKPGITGLWQVSGRSRLSYRRMTELDVEYVERQSLGLDLRILLRTIPVVLFNLGSAE